MRMMTRDTTGRDRFELFMLRRREHNERGQEAVPAHSHSV